VALDATELAPERYATAQIVMDEETEIGPENTVPTVSLGIDPSVV